MQHPESLLEKIISNQCTKRLILKYKKCILGKYIKLNLNKTFNVHIFPFSSINLQ